ncbi:MAG: nucleotidyltransferase family protein [Candidatus Rokubacteria bacterium]|nr:nucleotidyltransferase family protein [Candidatus Rokubacteria bacterium]
MKAFLLAAGKGDRLRPLTDRLPKCLLEVGGQPLLGRWLDMCRAAGVREVLVNTHHLADQVVAYLRQRRGDPAVSVVHEPRLLGSAGTVCANLEFVGDGPDFLVIYVDNYAVLDLARLVARHRSCRADFTLVVAPTECPTEKGIVALDTADRVIAFQEKPTRPSSNLMNGGIYVVATAFMREIAERLGDRTPLDFGFDVLPQAVGAGRTYAFRLGPDEFLIDVGTPTDYARVMGGQPA